MKITYVPMFVIALVLMSGLPLIVSPGAMSYASARYAPDDTQTQANTNDCNTGTNCAISSPQTQGDGTANSPINLQISNFNEEERDGVVGGLSIILFLDDCTGETGARDFTCTVIIPPEFTLLECNGLCCRIMADNGDTVNAICNVFRVSTRVAQAACVAG